MREILGADRSPEIGEASQGLLAELEQLVARSEAWIRRTGIQSIPLQEIRSDVCLLLDRVVVAINAVRDQRVARNNRVLVEFD